MKKKTILFFVTEDWYFCCHWMNFAIAAKVNGYQVIIVTQISKHKRQILEAGLKLIPIELTRKGVNPFKEIWLLFKLILIYRRERPDLVHQVAMKPILYGSIAAMLCNIKGIVNAVAGLGFIFTNASFKARVLRPVIVFLFGLLAKDFRQRFIFQNSDDLKVIFPVPGQLNAIVIRGVGVDINYYQLTSEVLQTPIIMLASRLIWDKGILEFVTAARIVLADGYHAKFVLVGNPDEDNPRTVKVEQLESWVQEGIIEWWGFKENMALIYPLCNVFCLPTTYGEGLPTVLLEAAATGRALIATDAPGCREIVRDNVNGLLVPLENPKQLAVVMKMLIRDPKMRHRMGLEGRKIVEQEFSLERVVSDMLVTYDELC